jgi:hypothetical protein
MNARITGLIGMGLALAAAPVRAEDAVPGRAGQDLRTDDRAPWDVTGRLRVGHDRLSLELGGALVELRMSGEPLSSGGPLDREPGAHHFRATFSLDGRTTDFLLRFVPPRVGEARGEH